MCRERNVEYVDAYKSATTSQIDDTTWTIYLNADNANNE